MLLFEKKIWDIVENKTPRPKSIDEHMMKEQVAMNTMIKKNIEKIIIEWNEKNDEALHIISFTIIECLQGLILYEKNVKGAWDELQRIHASRYRQRKYSLLRYLYKLDMQIDIPLRDHEQIFDILIQSLIIIDKIIDDLRSYSLAIYNPQIQIFFIHSAAHIYVKSLTLNNLNQIKDEKIISNYIISFYYSLMQHKS